MDGGTLFAEVERAGAPLDTRNPQTHKDVHLTIHKQSDLAMKRHTTPIPKIAYSTTTVGTAQLRVLRLRRCFGSLLYAVRGNPNLERVVLSTLHRDAKCNDWSLRGALERCRTLRYALQQLSVHDACNRTCVSALLRDDAVAQP